MIDRWDDLPTIWVAIATVAVIGVFGAAQSPAAARRSDLCRRPLASARGLG